MSTEQWLPGHLQPNAPHLRLWQQNFPYHRWDYYRLSIDQNGDYKCAGDASIQNFSASEIGGYCLELVAGGNIYGKRLSFSPLIDANLVVLGLRESLLVFPGCLFSCVPLVQGGCLWGGSVGRSDASRGDDFIESYLVSPHLFLSPPAPLLAILLMRTT